MIKIRNKEIDNKDIKKLAIKYKTTEKIIKLLLNRGYKEEELYKKFLDKMKELDIDVISLHTSRTRRLYSI